MNATTSINMNPYGYGATTPVDVLRYLTRHVNSSVFASNEELYAAQLIEKLQTQLTQQSSIAPALPQSQELHALQQQIKALQKENAALKIEKELDEQRLKYCLENTIIYSNNCLYADLEQESVINGDVRTALDKLLSHL